MYVFKRFKGNETERDAPSGVFKKKCYIIFLTHYWPLPLNVGIFWIPCRRVLLWPQLRIFFAKFSLPIYRYLYMDWSKNRPMADNSKKRQKIIWYFWRKKYCLRLYSNEFITNCYGSHKNRFFDHERLFAFKNEKMCHMQIDFRRFL